MSYKILGSVVKNEVLEITVEYNYSDGSTISTKVNCFQPTDKKYILDAIENRMISEKTKAEAIKKNLALKTEVDAEIGRVLIEKAIDIIK